MNKRVALLTFTVGLLACQRSAAVGSGAAGDQRCTWFSTHAEEIGCRERIAAASRAQMLRALAVNRRSASALDTEYNRNFPNHATDGHRGFAATLNASQVSWEEYAAAQCYYEAEKNFGGSGGWDREANCKNRLNRQRLMELRTLLATDRADGAITRK